MVVLDDEIAACQCLGKVMNGNIRPIHPNHLVTYYSFEPVPLYPLKSHVGSHRVQFERFQQALSLSHSRDRQEQWKKRKVGDDGLSEYELLRQERINENHRIMRGIGIQNIPCDVGHRAAS